MRTAPDWPSIRAAAVTVGVREAARQASVDLPKEEQKRFIERAMKRCSREGWMSAAMSAAVSAATNGPSALSANVRNGAEIVQQSIAEHGVIARSSLAKALVTGAAHLRDADGETVVAKSRALKDLAGAGAAVFGWNEGAASVRVNVYADLGSLRAGTVQDGPVIDV